MGVRTLIKPLVCVLLAAVSLAANKMGVIVHVSQVGVKGPPHVKLGVLEDQLPVNKLAHAIVPVPVKMADVKVVTMEVEVVQEWVQGAAVQVSPLVPVQIPQTRHLNVHAQVHVVAPKMAVRDRALELEFNHLVEFKRHRL